MTPFLVWLGLYVGLGLIYAPVVLYKRFRSYQAFTRLGAEAIAAADRSLPAYNAGRRQQTVSLLSSAAVLVCILGVIFTMLTGVQFLAVYWLSLFGLILLPPVVFFANSSSIWDKAQVAAENAALYDGDKTMRVYYGVMVTVWCSAFIGSVALLLQTF